MTDTICVFLNGPNPAYFCLFSFFSHNKYSTNTIIQKAQVVCLGLEPGAAGWQAQANPLSYQEKRQVTMMTIIVKVQKSTFLPESMASQTQMFHSNHPASLDLEMSHSKAIQMQWRYPAMAYVHWYLFYTYKLANTYFKNLSTKRTYKKSSKFSASN